MYDLLKEQFEIEREDSQMELKIIKNENMEIRFNLVNLIYFAFSLLSNSRVSICK